VRPVNADWPIGPVCTACYEHIRNNPAPCARCAVPQPLIAITADGDPICGPCAGVVVNYFCRTCGDGGRQYADGECVRCVLAQRLDDLLADDHGIIPEQLRPVRVALGEVEHPISIIGWLRKSESARLLARLARMREPITHQLLDSLPPSRNLYYVRDVLVHTSVLEPRNEYLERLGPWLDEVLAEQPAHIGRTIRPFMHWYILRRARRRAKARPFTTASGANARGHVRVAIALLAWLDEQGAALSEVTQAGVDTWLESGSTDRYDIRYFLFWAAGHGICRRINVPLRPVSQVKDMILEDERWAHLRRCLDDDDLPDEIRVAGALIALFGLNISAVIRLTSGSLLTDESGTRLIIDKSPVLLPPRLSELMHRLAETARPGSAIGRVVSGSAWLFPGSRPGHHTSPSAMGRRLMSAGIEARPVRNAALYALGEDLPAAIFANLVGLHITTAERWAKLARRDWADYLEARAVYGRGERRDLRPTL
jgi:hypothetical protein